jgi:endonuclease/exonuclease/phosphatase family metal-dependent hydrolase
LKSSENFLLQKLSSPSLVQKFASISSAEVLQRGTLSACFEKDGRIIRIINVHLAWEGGFQHRISQLKQVKEILEKNLVDADILAGDFNTFAPVMFRKIQEKKINNILLGWTNVLSDFSWTCDASYTAPQDSLAKFTKIGKLFGIKFRCKLDHIFVKNLKVISKEMFDLPGSDHRPFLVDLEIV